MIARRDLVVALLTSCTVLAAVALAETGGRPLLHSRVFRWDNSPVEVKPTGEKRSFFVDKTPTLDRLSCHVTTVNAGEASHAPHKHPEEELIIIKEGTFEVLQNGKVSTATAGDVVFEASNEMHGMRNSGTEPGSYYVLKFWTPGMLD